MDITADGVTVTIDERPVVDGDGDAVCGDVHLLLLITACEG